MSEVPLNNDAKSPPSSFGLVAVIILLVVFAPAAVAWLFSTLHP